MKKLIVLLVLFPCVLFAAKKSKFSEYKVEEFEFEGHEAKVVFPHKANEKRNWIWRARFWGHQPQLDKALLQKGFHVVYVDVADLFGSDKAVNLWDHFYEYCQRKYRLSQKVVLEGMSRGGLIVYNWASQNTHRVASIYADAPVCNIKSWPAGLYESEGSERAWLLCQQVYGLDTKEKVAQYKEGPIYNSALLAKAKVPVIHVYGDVDVVVPYAENTALVEEQYRKHGGVMKVIKKEGVGHHPHCLVDPTPIVDFILKHL